MEKVLKKIIGVCFTGIIVLNTQIPALAQIYNAEENKGIIRTQSQSFDTRSLAMGSATIADLFGNVSMGVNAALPGLYKNDLFFQLDTYHNWDTNLIQYGLTLPTITMGPHHITARLSFLNNGYDEINYLGTSTRPEPDVSMYQADVAYSLALSDVFSVGVLQSVSFIKNEESQYLTYIADLGLVYAPQGYVSYGMVFRGIGRTLNYEIIETGQTTLGSGTSTKSLEIGATIHYPIEDRTFLSISLSNQKRFTEEGLWYKGGIEILPISVLSLRAGVLAQLDDSIFIPRFGIGINMHTVRVDYVIAPNDLLGEHFHQMGLTIQF